MPASSRGTGMGTGAAGAIAILSRKCRYSREREKARKKKYRNASQPLLNFLKLNYEKRLYGVKYNSEKYMQMNINIMVISEMFGGHQHGHAYK
jgi:hypothetical protein